MLTNIFVLNRNKKPHASDNSTFQNLSINTSNTSNISSNQSHFSGSCDLKQNLDVLYHQGYFPSTNFTGYQPSGYQMTVPPQTFWQGQNTSSSWSTNNVTQTQQLTSNTNCTMTQVSQSGGMKSDIFAPNLIKKQNNNNLIDLNFFDSIENPKDNFVNVTTSVLEAFDPLLYGQSNISSSVEKEQSK